MTHRKIAVAAVAVVLLATAGSAVYWQSSGLMMADVQRVSIGMTQDQVQAILGSGAVQYYRPEVNSIEWIYHGYDGQIYVRISSSGKVVEVRQIPYANAWQRWRNRFGFYDPSTPG